ncbi:MAG: hypothetical protein ABI618_09595 [Nitrospirota bacterium]
MIIGSALVRNIADQHSVPTFLTDIQHLTHQLKSALLPVTA